MSAPSTARPAPASSPWPMYRAMVGVGLVCGVAIVGVYELTKPIIAEKRAAALESAVFQALPDARSSQAFRYEEGVGFRAASAGEPAGPLVYAGYDAGGGLAGVAIEAQGMGYQDVVRLLYGYDPSGQRVVGMRVLESKETPGLGDKILTDEGFAANFSELDLSLTPDGDLANPVVAVKEGEKRNAWEIDGITGATISSVAVADIISSSAATWTPRIQRHLGDFQEGR